MTPLDQKHLTSEIANHIRYVAGKLYDYGILKDTSPLLASAGKLSSSLNTDEGTTYTYLDDLTFIHVDPDRKMRKIRPSTVDVETGFELIVSSEYKLCLPILDYSDPFKALTINFKLQGLHEEGFVYNSWHIDRHIQEDNEVSNFPHPLYHIQYGGKEMTENKDLNFGSVLLVDSPRIPFAPTDIILSIDYVLSNYYGKIWYEMHSDIRYIEAIKLSQDMIWLPYYKAIHEFMSKQVSSDENSYYKEIIPSLV